MTLMRLDKYLQEKFNLKSRTYAENLIKTGQVLVNGKTASKTGTDVDDSFDIRILEDNNYASQGAYKLEGAFEAFDLNVQDKACVDLGCSNGGFTDCLLRHCAKSVLAIDVADCALEKFLLDSNKVTFLKANARELPDDLGEYDFVCGDLSFISQKHILPSVYKLLKHGGEAVMLIKPQFELDKSALNKNGIVSDEKLRTHAIELVKGYAMQNSFEVLSLATSPIRYENKNVEYLLHLKK